MHRCDGNCCDGNIFQFMVPSVKKNSSGASFLGKKPLPPPPSSPPLPVEFPTPITNRDNGHESQVQKTNQLSEKQKQQTQKKIYEAIKTFQNTHESKTFGEVSKIQAAISHNQQRLEKIKHLKNTHSGSFTKLNSLEKRLNKRDHELKLIKTYFAEKPWSFIGFCGWGDYCISAGLKPNKRISAVDGFLYRDDTGCVLYKRIESCLELFLVNPEKKIEDTEPTEFLKSLQALKNEKGKPIETISKPKFFNKFKEDHGDHSHTVFKSAQADTMQETLKKALKNIEQLSIDQQEKICKKLEELNILLPERNSEGCPCCNMGIDLDELAVALKYIGTQKTEEEALFGSPDIGMDIYIPIVMPLAVIGLTAAYRNITGSKKIRQGIKKVLSELEQLPIMMSELLNKDIDEIIETYFHQDNYQAFKKALQYSKRDCEFNILVPGIINGIASLAMVSTVAWKNPLATPVIAVYAAGQTVRNAVDTGRVFNQKSAHLSHDEKVQKLEKFGITYVSDCDRKQTSSNLKQQAIDKAKRLSSSENKKEALNLIADVALDNSINSDVSSTKKTVVQKQKEKKQYDLGRTKDKKMLKSRRRFFSANTISFGLYTAGAVCTSLAIFTGGISLAVGLPMFIGGAVITSVLNNKWPKKFNPNNSESSIDRLSSTEDECIKVIGRASAAKKELKEYKKSFFPELYTGSYNRWKIFNKFLTSFPKTPKWLKKQFNRLIFSAKTPECFKKLFQLFRGLYTSGDNWIEMKKTAAKDLSRCRDSLAELCRKKSFEPGQLQAYLNTIHSDTEIHKHAKVKFFQELDELEITEKVRGRRLRSLWLKANKAKMKQQLKSTQQSDLLKESFTLEKELWECINQQDETKFQKEHFFKILTKIDQNKFIAQDRKLALYKHLCSTYHSKTYSKATLDDVCQCYQKTVTMHVIENLKQRPEKIVRDKTLLRRHVLNKLLEQKGFDFRITTDSLENQWTACEILGIDELIMRQSDVVFKKFDENSESLYYLNAKSIYEAIKNEEGNNLVKMIDDYLYFELIKDERNDQNAAFYFYHYLEKERRKRREKERQEILEEYAA